MDAIKARELGRRVTVQLLIGVLVAFACVYLPMSDAVHKAELDNAMTSLGFGGSSGWPTGWKVLYLGLGLAIVVGVYRSFDVRWRASIVVVGLSILAGVVTVSSTTSQRNALWPVIVFATLVVAIGLTFVHERWLGGYEDGDD